MNTLAASKEVSKAATNARKNVIAAYGEAYDGADISNTEGMSYDRPIRAKKFPPPDQLVQWRMPDNTLTGNFFDPTGNSTPSQLGISAIGRTREVYVPQGRGLAIEGYGRSKYPDDWTMKNRKEITEGGTPQWFIADQAKPLVEDMSASGKTWRDFVKNKKWVEQPDGSYTSKEGRLTKDVYTVDNRNPPPPKITLTQWTLEPAE